MRFGGDWTPQSSFDKVIGPLLMEGILQHLGCIKPCKWSDICHNNWCRISSINQWLFLVPLIGGRWYIITQYWSYITYHLLREPGNSLESTVGFWTSGNQPGISTNPSFLQVAPCMPFNWFRRASGGIGRAETFVLLLADLFKETTTNRNSSTKKKC